MRIKAKLLKQYLGAISKIDKEPCVRLTNDGLSTISVDPAHVCIMSINIPKSDDLEITEEPLNFCIDSEQFGKYISNYKPETMLDMKIDGERCIVTDGKLKFTARLLVDKQPPKVPRLTLPATATIQTKDVKAILSAKYDNVRFSVMGGTLTVSAGDEQDSIEVSNKAECQESLKATYPADYLTNALHGENIKIQFGNDLPCTITPDLEGMEIVTLIAPRIEND